MNIFQIINISIFSSFTLRITSQCCIDKDDSNKMFHIVEADAIPLRSKLTKKR